MKTAERQTVAAVPGRPATTVVLGAVRRNPAPRHGDVVQRLVEGAPAGPMVDPGYGDIVDAARQGTGPHGARRSLHDEGGKPSRHPMIQRRLDPGTRGCEATTAGYDDIVEVARSGSAGVAAMTAGGPERAIAAAASSTGSPLPAPLMRKFERSLGADLSEVRVHTGEASQRAAKAVNAKAYTIGHDIHFGARGYDPASSGGQHLLAHEVAHTVQQAGGAQRMKCKLELSSPGDDLEREADRAADAMVDPGAAGVSGAWGSAHRVVQRQPAKPPASSAAAAEAAFNATHVYSNAPEAAKKRKLDEQIMGGDYSKGNAIDMHSAAYLKQLVSLAGKGATTVKVDAQGLQFFIIKGGGEGFLPAGYKGSDASDVTEAAATTGNQAGTVMHFDNNDLIAAFDAKGALISSALLQRPLSIENPNIWTRPTANKIYDAWDNQHVSLYQNTNFDIKYYGLRVDDKLGYYSSGKARIDLHKQENTNGCIFIVDPNTPSVSDPALSAFEPKFITEVMARVGNKRSNIGVMHMVDVK